MTKKLCLFCDEYVSIEEVGNHDRYVSCYCSPGGFYSLLRNDYEAINAFSYTKKRLLFPNISAYIRELTDCDEKVVLSIDELEIIENSPRIPATVEEKSERLLQYLYRHSKGPDEQVSIHPLSQNYNLTYSPNLQELVYIIEMLRTAKSIVREGVNFSLTEKGWSEAAARAGGKKLKSCFVFLSDDDQWCEEWSERVLPKIEQCGFLPHLFNLSGTNKGEPYSLKQLADSELVIADLSNQSADVYFAAGYALGMSIPVIWTVKRGEADKLFVQKDQIRPLEWDTSEELTAMLQQRLNV